MKLRKTIAAIAAVALTVSAMSVAVLADVSDTDTSAQTVGEQKTDKGLSRAAGDPTVDGISNGTGSATIENGEAGVDKVVNVTLTPSDADTPIAGSPQQGAADGTPNYHVVIPLDGIEDGWTFDTANGSQYDFDEAEHTYNIDENVLKLWLPITDGGEYTIVIKNSDGTQSKKIVVKTAHGTAPVASTSSTTEATTTTEATETEEVLPPSAGSLPSLTPGSGSSSAEAAPADAVSSPAEISASKNADVTVNAASEPVSAEMVTAFVNNDAAKTMTLSYGSALKVAVNKEDVTDAETANLDFSVSGENFLSSSDIEDNEVLSEATKIVQIDFVSEGKIDGVDKVTVKSKVGVKLAGKTVTVFEYVDGKLVNLGKTEVTASGYVKFKTDHFGQFVLAVE